MIDKNLLEILREPTTGEKLRFSEDALVAEKSGRLYEIRSGIPIMLPPDTGDDRYVEHYKIDGELFDYFEERECKATAHDERRLREYILSLAPNKVGRALDAGSGGAWFARAFAEKADLFCAFDLSERNVAGALDLCESTNCVGVVGDAMNPPFAENSFDLIVASEVIEHTPDPKKFAESLFRLLAPGGRMIIGCPYKEKISYHLCVHCNRPTPANAHLHSIGEKDLESYISESLANFNFFTFGNKALLLLRTYVLLKFLPFGLWKAFDRAANLVLKKQAHILGIYDKK